MRALSSLCVGCFYVRPPVVRTYTRLSRAAANVAVLAILGALLVVGRHGGLAVAIAGLAVAGAAIVCYGRFIASQHCSKCRESVVVPWSSYDPAIVFFAVVTPLRVPLRCPHCGARTPFSSHTEQ
jgi:hypothetical protein